MNKTNTEIVVDENNVASTETEINKLISIENRFWEHINLKTDSISEITEYLMSKKTFDSDNFTDAYDFERRKYKKQHYLIYLIRNKTNGKIYVGQHMTLKVFDTYYGSGSKLSLDKAKYGIDNFEKTILFDFDSFAEMNDMEGMIVTNDFRERDDTYNTIIGGMQTEYPTYRGMTLYHNNELHAEKFFKDGEVPDGWIKGGLSTFSKEENDRRRKLFTLLYSEYLEHGLEYVIEKYGVHYTRTGFNVLCRKYAENFTSRGRREVNLRKHVERITEWYNMYVEHGYEYVYEHTDCKLNRSDLSHEFRKYALGYDGNKRRDKEFADKIEYYTKLYEETKTTGRKAVADKIGITVKRLSNNFKKYVEEYRKTHTPIRGKTISKELEQICNEMYLYYMEHDINETAKQFNRREDKRRLQELITLGVNKELKEKIDKKYAEKHKIEFAKNKIYYTELYDEFKKNGFRGVKEKYDYRRDINHLRRQFRKYVDEFQKTFNIGRFKENTK